MNIFTTDQKKINTSFSDSKIMITIFLLSLFLIPFDDLPYMSILGGLGKRASVYTFAILIAISIFLFIKNKKVFFINTIENYLILAFYSSCIFSILVNFPSISESLLVAKKLCDILSFDNIDVGIFFNIPKLFLLFSMFPTS